MAAKVFKTIEEQLDILKSKNLTIEDYDKAKTILLRENYFFLNGKWLSFSFFSDWI